eukprot:scaffold14931_cov19-Tisochrysis_lutea.AAC.2
MVSMHEPLTKDSLMHSKIGASGMQGLGIAYRNQLVCSSSVYLEPCTFTILGLSQNHANVGAYNPNETRVGSKVDISATVQAAHTSAFKTERIVLSSCFQTTATKSTEHAQPLYSALCTQAKERHFDIARNPDLPPPGSYNLDDAWISGKGGAGGGRAGSK